MSICTQNKLIRHVFRNQQLMTHDWSSDKDIELAIPSTTSGRCRTDIWIKAPFTQGHDFRAAFSRP